MASSRILRLAWFFIVLERTEELKYKDEIAS